MNGKELDSFIKSEILRLVRLRLGVQKYEYFQFENQKKNAIYCFDDVGLKKISPATMLYLEYSNVSFNWLLDNRCKVRILTTDEMTAICDRYVSGTFDYDDEEGDDDDEEDTCELS